ncbi:MAG: pseudouridine synthase [Candidatus Saccharimonadales bacterium]
MRLNAYLAKSGVASRRGADVLIKSGRVTVNGKTGELNAQVSDKDLILLDGKAIKLQKFRHILLNKPTGTVTTLKDPEGRRTVKDLVDIPERVVPIGRLDYNTTGVLLLTNDGEMANKLMHPRYGVEKVYEAEVEGTITSEILNKLSIGVRLEDGVTAPAKARQLTESRVELIVHEGRNHQVRRMLESVGLPVKKLHRSRYGPILLGGLKPGQWRNLEAVEIKNLTDNG